MHEDPQAILRRRIQSGICVLLVVVSGICTWLVWPSAEHPAVPRTITEAAAGPTIVVAKAKTPRALVIPKKKKVVKKQTVVTQNVAAPVTTSQAATNYVAPAPVVRHTATAAKKTSSSGSADAEFGPG